ncbi:hypothetical protein D3C73_1357460 [compost metagenome]
MFRLFGQNAKHIGLTDGFGFCVLIGGFKRVVQRIHQCGAMRAKAVKRPGHDQFFQHPAV